MKSTEAPRIQSSPQNNDGMKSLVLLLVGNHVHRAQVQSESQEEQRQEGLKTCITRRQKSSESTELVNGTKQIPKFI